MSEFKNPPLMAIGDSLYQGVRSLTVRAEMMRLCAPRTVAQGLGLGDGFAVPQPARPVIINMEHWLHAFPDFDEINRDLKRSARYWRTDPGAPDGRSFHDNISVASAQYNDLIGAGPLGLSRTQAQAWIDANMDAAKWEMLESLDGIVELAGSGVNLGTLVMALNTRYTLCPDGANDPHNLAGLTPVEQVDHRKPHRLLVNIGSNQGLWEMAFEAQDSVTFDFSGLDQLAQQLDATEVPHIYFNGLGLPSTVANLMPVEHFAYMSSPVPGHYFDEYENRFGFGYNTLSGAQVRGLDQQLRQINEQVKQRVLAQFAKPERVHFVDLAGVLEAHDTKHDWRNDDKALRMSDDKRLTNVTTETSPWPLPRLQRGGLFGLDGMHLSAVGYGLMAQAVLNGIAQKESLSPQPVDFEQLYEEDRLLDNAPRSWSYLLWLWRDIRRARARGDQPDEAEESARAKKVMDPALRAQPGGTVR